MLVESNRVVVEGVNFVTKHVRVGQTQRGTKTGGIETVEAPDPHLERGARRPRLEEADPCRLPRREVTKDGVTKTVRVRYAKKSGKDL